jgi:hypothetical protein
MFTTCVLIRAGSDLGLSEALRSQPARQAEKCDRGAAAYSSTETLLADTQLQVASITRRTDTKSWEVQDG